MHSKGSSYLKSLNEHCFSFQSFLICKNTVWTLRWEHKISNLSVLCLQVYGGGMRPQNWVDHWSKVVGGSNGTTSSSMGSSVEEIMEVDVVPAATTSSQGGKRRGRGK